MSDFDIKTVIPAAPANDNIIVEQFSSEQESEQGLDLSQAHSLVAEETPVGVVVATGPDTPQYIYPGITVMLRKYTGTQVVIAGTLYYVYAPRDVLAIALDPSAFDDPPAEDEDV